MLVQPVPVALQRVHWYLNVTGCVPVQLPLWAVSTLPTIAVPEMLGRVVFVGGPVAADALTAVATSTATAAAVSASHERRAPHLR
jgi:hypothetical protein